MDFTGSGVRVYDISILNVDAQSLRAKREELFQGLYGWYMSSRSTILLGDFNFVLSPQLDRLGPNQLAVRRVQLLDHCWRGQP